MQKRMVNGATVKVIRELLGIKQGEFAIACDITPGYLSNVEAGRKQPSPEVRQAIRRRLGVPMDAITYVIGVEREEAA